MGVSDEEYLARGLHVLAELGWISGPEDRTPPPGYPDESLWLYTVENLWGRVWSRPGLSLRLRQLATVAALLHLHDADGLRTHMRHSQRLGITVEQLRSTVLLSGHYSGWPSIELGFRVLTEVADHQGEGPTRLSEPVKADSEHWFAAGLRTLSDLGWNRGPDDAEPMIAGSDQGFWNHTIEALFGRAYAVPGLSLKEKQVVVMATIIAHSNQVGIRTHYLRCHNAGVSETEVRELLLQVGYYTGWPCFSVGTIWFNQLLAEAGDQWPASMRASLPTLGQASTSQDLSGIDNEGGTQ